MRREMEDIKGTEWTFQRRKYNMEIENYIECY